MLWQTKTMEILCYFIVFTVPLYFSVNHFYHFEIPKSLIFFGSVLTALLFFLWGKWKEKDIKIEITPLHIVLFIFLLILTISSFLGVDSLNSFFGWRQSVNLIFIYGLSIFACLIGWLVRKDEDFLKNVLLFSFLSSLLTMIIFYTGLPSIFSLEDGSTLGNSSYLGGYLLFNIFFGLSLFFSYKKYWQKILVALGILFIFFSPIFLNKEILLGKISLLEAIKSPMLFLGIANGAFLGVGVSVIVIALLFLINSNKKKLKIIGAILFAIFLLSAFYVGKELTTSGSNLNKIYVEQKGGNRFLAWEIAETNFYQHPLLGTGLNNYIYAFQKNYTADFYKGEYSPERLNQPHNAILGFLSDTGILGTVSYLVLFILVFMILYYKKGKENQVEKNIPKKYSRETKIILAGLLFGYFVQNLFVFDTITTYLMFFLIVGVAIGVSHYRWQFQINEKFLIIKKVFIVFLAIVVFVSLFIFVYQPWKESKEWGRIAFSSNNILKYFPPNNLQKISILGGVQDSTFLASKLFDLFQNNLYKVKDEDKNIFLKEIEASVAQVEEDVKIQPNYADAYLIIGKFLNLHMMVKIKEGGIIKLDGENYDKEIWQKAFSNLSKALELNPQNPQIYFALSQTYFIKKDMENARVFAKKGILIAPEYKGGFDFAKGLLKMEPNKEFETFLIKALPF